MITSFVWSDTGWRVRSLSENRMPTIPQDSTPNSLLKVLTYN